MSVVCEGVHKVYGDKGYETIALSDVSLRIDSGDFVCIMGASGSGKSTLLNLIGALDKPTEGKIFIDGADISKSSENALAQLRNQKIGFIYQSFNLIQRMTALENVETPLLTRDQSDRQVRERARTVLKWVGLGHRMRHTPDRLSGGEQQRLATARALVTQPSIILGDEPTGNLDTKTALSIMDMLKGLNSALNVTVILVTHSQDVAAYAHRIVHIKDGRIERVDNKLGSGASAPVGGE